MNIADNFGYRNKHFQHYEDGREGNSSGPVLCMINSFRLQCKLPIICCLFYIQRNGVYLFIFEMMNSWSKHTSAPAYQKKYF